MDNEKVKKHLMDLGMFSESELKDALRWDKGPTIITLSGLGYQLGGSGQYDVDEETIALLEEDMKAIQKAESEEDKQAALLNVVSTILHETVHHGRAEYYEKNRVGINKRNGWEYGDPNAVWITESDFGNNLYYSEQKDLFEDDSEYKQTMNTIGDTEAGDVFEYTHYDQFIRSSDDAKKVINRSNNGSEYFISTVPK